MLGPRRRACRQLPVHVVPSLARLLAVLRLGKSGRPLAAEMRPDRCLRAGHRQRNIQLSLRVCALPRLCLRVRGHLVSRLVARMPGVRRHEVQGHVTAAAPFQPVQVLPDSRACLARLSVRPPLHRLQRRLRVREKVDGSHRRVPSVRSRSSDVLIPRRLKLAPSARWKAAEMCMEVLPMWATTSADCARDANRPQRRTRPAEASKHLHREGQEVPALPAALLFAVSTLRGLALRRGVPNGGRRAAEHARTASAGQHGVMV